MHAEYKGYKIIRNRTEITSRNHVTGDTWVTKRIRDSVKVLGFNAHDASFPSVKAAKVFITGLVEASQIDPISGLVNQGEHDE